MLIIEDLFKGRYFDREIIILCARWHLPVQAQLSRSRGNDQ
jgi:hypothetical protein